MHQQTLALLRELESTLQRHSLWQTTPIDPSALNSSVPFCHDTMAFEQWLQFVFLEKMHALIAHAQPLPRNFAIAPMAEMMLAQHSGGNDVITVLQKLDQLLSDN
jgi:uncharacterized protein YqcC (DUF446 family)